MLTPLKRIRMEKGIKQWRLASILEIHPQELSNYEVGRRRCPADLRHRIADVLESTVEQIFPNEEERL